MEEVYGKFQKNIQAEYFIQAYILEKKLKAGDAILSENALIAKLKFSRTTIRRALKSLTERGLLARHPGSGTFVADMKRIDHDVHPTPHGNIVWLNNRGEFSMNIARGIERVCDRRGFRLIHINCASLNESISELQSLNLFEIDGCIMSANDRSVYRKTASLPIRLPVVYINDPEPNSNHTCVSFDDYSGSCNAVRYLITLGHRKILHLAGARKFITVWNRAKGYESAMRQAGLQEHIRVEYADFSVDAAYRKFSRLCEKKMDFTAVFCSNDDIAAGVYRYCHEHDILIPEHLSVLGFGNLTQSREFQPPLSTVEQNPEMLGSSAAGLLIAKILREGNWNEPQRETVPVQLMIRNSCIYYKGK